MKLEHVSFDDTMMRGTLLVLRSWSRSQETDSATATVDSRFGIFILLYENRPTNERADGWANEQTNERTKVSCWRRRGFIPRFHVSSPRLLRTKGGDL